MGCHRLPLVLSVKFSIKVGEIMFRARFINIIIFTLPLGFSGEFFRLPLDALPTGRFRGYYYVMENLFCINRDFSILQLFSCKC